MAKKRSKQDEASTRKLATLAINRTLAKNDKHLLAILMKDDDFRATILGMSYLEILLRTVVDYRLKNASALPYMQIAQLTNFAVALGAFGAKVGETLKQLGNIRNLYAHSVVYLIHESDVMALRSAFAKIKAPKLYARIEEYIKEGHFEENIAEHKVFVRTVLFVMYLIVLGIHDEDGKKRETANVSEAQQSLSNALAALADQSPGT